MQQISGNEQENQSNVSHVLTSRTTQLIRFTLNVSPGAGMVEFWWSAASATSSVSASVTDMHTAAASSSPLVLVPLALAAWAVQAAPSALAVVLAPCRGPGPENKGSLCHHYDHYNVIV